MRLSIFDIFFWLVFGFAAGYLYSSIELLGLLSEIEAACFSSCQAAGAGAGIGLPTGAHPPADGPVARLK